MHGLIKKSHNKWYLIIEKLILICVQIEKKLDIKQQKSILKIKKIMESEIDKKSIMKNIYLLNKILSNNELLLMNNNKQNIINLINNEKKLFIKTKFNHTLTK